MFEEYKKDLLKFYRIKRENHRLSVNLEEPGREKLRKECLEVFERKKTPRDKDFIKSVFDPTNDYEDQVRSIEKFNLDRFRPLISFLKEEVKIIRDDKLIKLLAWLLDFPTYSDWRELSEEGLKLIFDKATGNNSTPPIIIFPPDKPPLPSDDPPSTPPPFEEVYFTRFSPRQIIIACTLLLSICSISFLIWERMPISVRKPDVGENAMYWDGDHYEPVKAGAQKPGVAIIPLDFTLLQQQRKITLPDTLTKYSLGKVWYKGYGSNHEYFTFKGIYPADTARILKPLSTTILTKYTSNYRYYFTRLLWFLCAAFVISIGGYLVSRLKKEVKQPVEEVEKDVRNISEIELA